MQKYDQKSGGQNSGRIVGQNSRVFSADSFFSEILQCVIFFQVDPSGQVSRGFVGCLDDIRMDGVALPVHPRADSHVAELANLTKVCSLTQCCSFHFFCK